MLGDPGFAGYNAAMMDERFPRKLRLNEREVEARFRRRLNLQGGGRL